MVVVATPSSGSAPTSRIGSAPASSTRHRLHSASTFCSAPAFFSKCWLRPYSHPQASASSYLRLRLCPCLLLQTPASPPSSAPGSGSAPPSALPLPSALGACSAPATVRCRSVSKTSCVCKSIRSLASSTNSGAGGYTGDGSGGRCEYFADGCTNEATSELARYPQRIQYLLSIAGLLLGCVLVFSFVLSINEAPSTLVQAIAKSGFTAAFSLIFVSEIGDKTFFIAALLAMQYEKTLVLLGSMGALSLMTVLSVVIGRIFQSVPAQFQTTLPIGECAAVMLLTFFGFKSIKHAWELPYDLVKNNKEHNDLGEFVEAEELVKENVAKKLTDPLEIIWKSFSLVFFAEWGDRSMLATIALGAAQSPWGVAGGAITGHLFATTVAILGGAFLAHYISEKLVGYFGGVLFLVFAAATLIGIF